MLGNAKNVNVQDDALLVLVDELPVSEGADDRVTSGPANGRPRFECQERYQ